MSNLSMSSLLSILILSPLLLVMAVLVYIVFFTFKSPKRANTLVAFIFIGMWRVDAGCVHLHTHLSPEFVDKSLITKNTNIILRRFNDDFRTVR